jgi:4-carboxymuconolactone decarboxylase
MPRLRSPRIAPLAESEWTDEVRELLAPSGKTFRGQVPNVMATIARHPKLLRRWTVFANHVLFKSSLPGREREIAILRIGWLCQAEYEWGQHAIIGKKEGLTEDELLRICEGPEAKGWTPAERALLRATDELHEDAFVSDATWKELETHFSEHQRMDLVFAVGQYNLVSMALNTFGVQLDGDIDGFPKNAPKR